MKKLNLSKLKVASFITKTDSAQIKSGDGSMVNVLETTKSGAGQDTSVCCGIQVIT